jgi:hypothetical protein
MLCDRLHIVNALGWTMVILCILLRCRQRSVAWTRWHRSNRPLSLIVHFNEVPPPGWYILWLTFWTMNSASQAVQSRALALANSFCSNYVRRHLTVLYHDPHLPLTSCTQESWNSQANHWNLKWTRLTVALTCVQIWTACAINCSFTDSFMNIHIIQPRKLNVVIVIQSEVWLLVGRHDPFMRQRERIAMYARFKYLNSVEAVSVTLKPTKFARWPIGLESSSARVLGSISHTEWVRSVKYLNVTSCDGKALSFDCYIVGQSFFVACNFMHAHAKLFD